MEIRFLQKGYWLESNNQMRIISGKLKGKSIGFIKTLGTRPLKDSVKENIFNILEHSNIIKTSIEKANVLDVYSGVGSFGLECLSRGAAKVTFIEQNIKAFEILRKNLIHLSVLNQSILINGDIEKFIMSSSEENYSILFLDPPFADSEFSKNLSLIKEKKLYTNDHIIIIHRQKNSNDDLKFIKILFTKNYGRSKIIFGIFK